MKKQNSHHSSSSMAASNISYSRLESIFHCLTFERFRNPRPVVSVLRLSGVIGKIGIGRSGMTLEALNESIESAFAKPKLSALCLIINSPGGSPVQSELIANRIITLAKEKSVPVYSFVEDMAASGGYWLACAGDEIYASKSSVIGSIGVISSGFGFQEAIKKMGVERRIYTQGMNKSILDPFSPAKAGDIKILDSLQKEAHAHFIDYVKSRRKARLTQSDEVLFNGEFWAGMIAKDFGLIDGIDNIYSFIKKKFGDKVNIDYIKAKESWFKRKFMSSSLDSEGLVDALHSRLEQELVSSRFKIY